MAFAFREAPCGDDVNPTVSSDSGDDDQQSPIDRRADRPKPLLMTRVRLVTRDEAQRLVEDRRCLFERDAMFALVRSILGRIPGRI